MASNTPTKRHGEQLWPDDNAETRFAQALRLSGRFHSLPNMFSDSPSTTTMTMRATMTGGRGNGRY